MVTNQIKEDFELNVQVTNSLKDKQTTKTIKNKVNNKT